MRKRKSPCSWLPAFTRLTKENLVTSITDRDCNVDVIWLQAVIIQRGDCYDCRGSGAAVSDNAYSFLSDHVWIIVDARKAADHNCSGESSQYRCAHPDYHMGWCMVLKVVTESRALISGGVARGWCESRVEAVADGERSDRDWSTRRWHSICSVSGEDWWHCSLSWYLLRLLLWRLISQLLV